MMNLHIVVAWIFQPRRVRYMLAIDGAGKSWLRYWMTLSSLKIDLLARESYRICSVLFYFCFSQHELAEGVFIEVYQIFYSKHTEVSLDAVGRAKVAPRDSGCVILAEIPAICPERLTYSQ